MGIVATVTDVDANVHFPKNKIVLLNGNVIDCYLKQCIDGSSTSAPVGGYNDEQLLTDNAFFLLQHADQVLADSRMFLAPVPMHCNLAYTGSVGLRDIRLGILLEWWLSGPKSITLDEKGRPALTYFIAGSPLSGGNHCDCVYPDGTTAQRRHATFLPVWSSLMKLNQRYGSIKGLYEAYSLQQVVALLNNQQDRYLSVDDSAWKRNEVDRALSRCMPLIYKHRRRIISDPKLYHVEIPCYRSGGSFCGRVYLPIGELMSRWEQMPAYRLRPKVEGLCPIYVFQFGFGLSGRVVVSAIDLATGEIRRSIDNDGKPTGLADLYELPSSAALRPGSHSGYRSPTVPSRRQLPAPPLSFSELLNLVFAWQQGRFTDI